MPDYLALHACARGNKSPSHLYQIELGPAPSRNPNPHPEWHLTLALIPTQVEAELAIFDNLTMEQQNTEDAPKEAGCSWLQECQVSVSPTGELIGIANESKLVLLARK